MAISKQRWNKEEHPRAADGKFTQSRSKQPAAARAHDVDLGSVYTVPPSAELPDSTDAWVQRMKDASGCLETVLNQKTDRRRTIEDLISDVDDIGTGTASHDIVRSLYHMAAEQSMSGGQSSFVTPAAMRHPSTQASKEEMSETLIRWEQASQDVDVAELAAAAQQRLDRSALYVSALIAENIACLSISAERQ